MEQYTNFEKVTLLKVAKDAIEYGLHHQSVNFIDINDFPEKLRENAASFVTLKIEKQLRGCIGSLIAHRPLIQDVVHNAYAAAFFDHRFPALLAEEFAKINIQISILSKPQLITFTSETDLIKQLRPGLDGLILEESGYCGTFLPSVWNELPEPELFLQYLKLKAGLPRDYWSNTLTIKRYSVITIS